MSCPKGMLAFSSRWQMIIILSSLFFLLYVMYETIDGSRHLIPVQLHTRHRLRLFNVVQLVILTIPQIVKNELLIQLQLANYRYKPALLSIQRYSSRHLSLLCHFRAFAMIRISVLNIELVEFAIQTINALRVRISIDQLKQRTWFYATEILPFSLG